MPAVDWNQRSQTNPMTRTRCRALRKRGLSIGTIAKRLELSESTVHWHVKGIVLTAAQREKLRSQKRTLMAQVNARRRGHPLHLVAFRKPAWSKTLVHLVAHLSFDGRVDRYGCYYYNRSYAQAWHVKEAIESLLGVSPKIRQRPNGVWVVSYYNVAIAAWLQQKEGELLGVIQRQPNWRREWLKSFFDDEGHIHVVRSRRRVRASQDDPSVLQLARRFLGEMGISSRIDSRARAVEITGRANLEAFRQRINFSNGLRVNGLRKNGHWHHDFEKRELLDFALSSYTT